MVINFAETNLMEQPMLVLRNLDGTAIQTLGQAFNLECNLCFNEISSISFDVPAFVNGVKTPRYDDIVGSRIIDMVGWGQFILVNPKITDEGIKEIKSCKAYSLEYELTYKPMSIEEGTYNFWNPVAPDETIMGIILSYLPSWSVGEVDEDLIGKYRTFSVTGEKIYDFIKSTAQKTYGCIFDFDTYNRKIYVRSVTKDVGKSPIYISSDNLAKKIEIEEDTENILTVLDVNGADGVDIRGVNPMGTNKIYNLDYYMNTGNFSEDIIRRWNEWKSTYNNNQLVYYDLTIQKMLKTSAILTEENRLLELKSVDLASLENDRSVLIEYLASVANPEEERHQAQADRLASINNDIERKNREIRECEGTISLLEGEKDVLTAELEKINEATALSKYFTKEELKILDRYFKEDTIEESSFVATEAEAYVDSDLSNNITNIIFGLSGGNVTEILGYEGKQLFIVEGGSLTTGNSINANVVKASLERKNDGSFVFSGYLGGGTIEDMSFASGCISLTGSCQAISSDTIADNDSSTHKMGTALSFQTTSARFYFTKNTTEYERFSVEWDLYEYGCQCLEKLAYPSYSFDVSSVNFFAVEEFVAFAKSMALGNKIYLEVADEKVLEPIFVGLSFKFDDPTSLKLQFGDTYNLSDSSFSLVDLLEQSVSMGKTLDTNRFNYNSFIDSGASTAVKDYMSSALDVAKNAILSGSNMAISWDSSGIHCRKWNATGTGYEPEEIAIINNNIVFTDDGWQTAKMAIGHFQDANTGDSWGIIAPNIVGTLLAGENLVIESVKKDGDTAVFKVDADGAVLYNSKFELNTGKSHILLDPILGFGIGTCSVINSDNEWDTDNAKFWVDTNGNVHIKGELHGCDGTFSGKLEAATGSFEGSIYAKTGYFSGEVTGAKFIDSSNRDMMDKDYKFTADYLNLKGITVTNSSGEITFKVDESGNVTLLGKNSTLISPNIKTDNFVINSNTTKSCGLTLTGEWDGSEDVTTENMLRIYYWNTGAYPAVNFESGYGAVAQWLFDQTVFHGNIDFSNAKVNGMYAVFA